MKLQKKKEAKNAMKDNEDMNREIRRIDEVINSRMLQPQMPHFYPPQPVHPYAGHQTPPMGQPYAGHQTPPLQPQQHLSATDAIFKGYIWIYHLLFLLIKDRLRSKF